MNRSEKRWTVAAVDLDKVRYLREALNIHPELCSMLVQRGINNFEDARRFFRPSLDHLINPFLMKGMETAVKRLSQAIDSGEQVLIYGDYDVDGTTAISVMVRFLRPHLPTVEFYTPDRETEGYGVSFKGMDYAREIGAGLIITLDCGIRSIEQIEYARKNGCEVIVCDHHRPGEQLPPALAILDPKQDDCGYPYKELSGCGVGFKLLQGLCQYRNLPLEPLYDQLDLVAVSIASDIVQVTGENRVLMTYGLQKLGSNPSVGLKALIAESGLLEKKLSTDQIVFGIGPRINAAGRMAHAREAVNLLISEEEEFALNQARALCGNNIDRQEIDKEMYLAAITHLEADPENLSKKTTVVASSGWHKGVVGIVASRLIERFYRPTIVLTETDDLFVGSARSVQGYSVYDALLACDDLLFKWGGHDFAAGLSIEKNKLEAFKNRFEKVVSETILPEQLVPEISIDAWIDFDKVNDKFFAIVEQMGPFGPGNMKPVFATSKVTDTGFSRIVKEHHLKLSLRQNGRTTLSGIAFNSTHLAPMVLQRPANLLEVCFQIDENIFNGNRSLQLVVKDIREFSAENHHPDHVKTEKEHEA